MKPEKPKRRGNQKLRRLCPTHPYYFIEYEGGGLLEQIALSEKDTPTYWKSGQLNKKGKAHKTHVNTKLKKAKIKAGIDYKDRFSAKLLKKK